ncbi:hypothetical protein [Candidatus Magnetobacterium casense]|uniref:Uncharacterized protein n=1 Tax=Candidatus Magnetobacterium casense TaxID=1455061 RepID=A0ABS6RX61_9BACT|nr:hypothetical protein [Candidatus Magnetobacterium casensis]MBV6341221.1 hypothetical protein [Candidatus Magnetobacterium casensis]
METKKTNGEGKANMGLIVVAVLLAIIFFAMMPVMLTSVSSSFNAGSAVSMLEDRGYFVATADEYSDLMTLLQSVDTKADAAVANAEAAATAAQDTLDTLLLHNENEIFLYPGNVSSTVTLTAGVGVNTFGAWAEITGSDAITLSSCFTANSGYIREIMTHNYSAADKMYIIELSYGAAKTIIGRVKVRSDWTYVMPLSSAPITPAGETVYYRMKSETSEATLQADFRYYYD